MGELGSCAICSKDAGVLYPLLPGSPAFCSEHHNPRDAGPFGADFSGPDDFDIPEEWPFDFPHRSVPRRAPLQKLDVKTFVWTDREGERHRLKDIDDTYLVNIIRFLSRGEGQVSGGSETRRQEVIAFLKGVARKRGLEELISDG